eukprot:15139831-Alexandrium_andersonii.AAC.1
MMHCAGLRSLPEPGMDSEGPQCTLCCGCGSTACVRNKMPSARQHRSMLTNAISCSPRLFSGMLPGNTG